VIGQQPYLRSEQPSNAIRLRTRKNPAWVRTGFLVEIGSSLADFELAPYDAG
jgi:hypothetical protein